MNFICIYVLIFLLVPINSLLGKTKTVHHVKKEIYKESFDQDCGEWQAINNTLEHIKNGFLRGACQSNIRLTKDTAQWLDPNHLPQFNYIYLNFYISTGKLYEPSMKLKNFDFRNATIEFYIRGKDIELNDSVLLFVFGTAKDYENHLKYKPRTAQSAYWANIKNPLNKNLSDGEWHLVKFKLIPDIEFWKHAGYNPEQKYYNRYNYFPSIDYSLENVNMDILFLLTNIDIKKPPKSFDTN